MTRSAAVLSVLVLAASASAQEPAIPHRPSIRVSAEATVSVRPDQAQLQIGVVTNADTAAAAASQNAARLDAVIADLRKVFGTRAEIKTVAYSVTPNYRYPREGGKPTIAGYTASNVVEARTGELAEIGRAIDVATQSGANTIQRLTFSLKDERKAQGEALAQAASSARAKADAIAAALGLKLGRILLAEEVGAPVRPMYERPMMAMRAEAAPMPPTPVESGTVEVRAVVTLTVEIEK